MLGMTLLSIKIKTLARLLRTRGTAKLFLMGECAMSDEILRKRIKKVFKREIDRVEEIMKNIPGKNEVRLIYVVEEYKEILREILDEDDGRMV